MSAVAGAAHREPATSAMAIYTASVIAPRIFRMYLDLSSGEMPL
jgi:hypothetical protein